MRNLANGVLGELGRWSIELYRLKMALFIEKQYADMCIGALILWPNMWPTMLIVCRAHTLSFLLENYMRMQCVFNL